MWGHLRYLVIALTSGWAGACVGLATQPEGAIGGGASGTVLGLMAAEVVWVLCNRRHLPRAFRRRAQYGMIVNCVLLAVIFVSSGSGWGHVAGVAAGAAAALLLQAQRFGPPALRAPAGAAVVLVPVIAFAFLEYTTSDDKFAKRYVQRTQNLTQKAFRFYEKEVATVVGMAPGRRDLDTVASLLPRLDETRAGLVELVAGLKKAGPRHDEETEEARQVALVYAAAEAEWFERLAAYLRAGEAKTFRDERALGEQFELVKEKRKAWQARVQPAPK
jgi:hypothetical protein